jgi:hypothetical protein
MFSNSSFLRAVFARRFLRDDILSPHAGKFKGIMGNSV